MLSVELLSTAKKKDVTSAPKTGAAGHGHVCPVPAFLCRPGVLQVQFTSIPGVTDTGVEFAKELDNLTRMKRRHFMLVAKSPAAVGSSVKSASNRSSLLNLRSCALN